MWVGVPADDAVGLTDPGWLVFESVEDARDELGLPPEQLVPVERWMGYL